MTAPVSASINFLYATSSSDVNYYVSSSKTGFYNSGKYLVSLKNTIDWYQGNSKYFNYNTYISGNNTLLINIPSTFYGSSLKRGSVSLSFYYTGSLLAQLNDKNFNGELIQVSGTSGLNNTAGIVLYNEGIILLTGSWALGTGMVDNYVYSSTSVGESTSTDVPKWIHWGKSYTNPLRLNSSSFDFAFEGQTYTPTLTLFAHAEKGEFNTSNNPTYLLFNSGSSVILSSSNRYIENEYAQIKNTVKVNYSDVTGSFKKQTFISKIGIFDENQNLIAVAKLAKPIKKDDTREITFKLKLDL